MAEHHDTRRVLHGADDLFGLVADVRGYPDFIRFVNAMRVREESESAPGIREFTADASVGYKFIRERFTTRVRADAPARVIEVRCIEGPFRTLQNRWRFTALADGSTLVEFWIRYEFRNPLLQGLLEANYGRVIRFLINAFEKRAAKTLPRAGDPTVSEDALVAGMQAAE